MTYSSMRIAGATLCASTILIAAGSPLPSTSPGVVVSPAMARAVEASIANGPWSARRAATNICPKIYMLTSRTCPYCKAFLKEQLAPVDRAGYDLRLHMAAVVPESPGASAEIAYRRDFLLTMRHMFRTPVTGPDPGDDQAHLDAFNAVVRATQTFRTASRQAGYAAYLPSFVWQDRAGKWRIQSGYRAGSTLAFTASLPTPPVRCRADQSGS